MTAPELFFYILTVIVAQIAILSALAFYRHMRAYDYLKARLSGFDVTPPEKPILEGVLPQAGAGKTVSWKGLRDFRVERKLFENEENSICSFHLVPVDGKALPPFKPGQFLTFQVTVTDPLSDAPLDIVRCYSLSDAPGRDHYRVSIKRVPPPAGKADVPPGLSSNHFHDAVHEGTVLSVRAPNGHFFLEEGNGPVVLIAGGIGITPMLSMLNATLESGNEREIWLFYGVRNGADHAMYAHLTQMAEKHPNFHLHVCYSAPLESDLQGRDFRHKGHVKVDLLRRTLSFNLYDFYICGPRPMMETLVPALEDWGVPEQHIHYESFGPASISKSSRKQASMPEDDASNEQVTVTFSKSGKSLIWDGQDDTLLDFAERHGVDVDSGCRAGGCGSCQTTIEDGEVAYIQTPDFDPDPGSCLLCVSRPKQNLTLEA